MFNKSVGTVKLLNSIYKMSMIIIFSIVMLSCNKQGENQSQSGDNQNTSQDSLKIIKEKFISHYDNSDNVDSPAFWHNPDGGGYVIATSKGKHLLMIYDAESGELLKTYGKKGINPGEFSRPNGIFVIDDLCLVIERDNKRVQVLSLPDFKPLGFIASDKLVKPYGLWVTKDTTGYDLFLTDLHANEDEPFPPDTILAKSVLQYKFSVKNNVLSSKFNRYIGEQSGDGVTKIVESIVADPVNDNLFIAEEMPGNTFINVYSMSEGRFKGQTIGKGIYKYQAEGFTIFDCGGGEGYIIGTDQDKTNNCFHVFDRKTFKYIGTFRGESVENTDGVWLTQTTTPKFPKGALYAVNNDGGICAFDWRDIAAKLNLNCGK